MKTFSTAFQNMQSINSNKKVYLVQLGSLYLSSSPIVVDGVQYTPCINAMQSTQLKWNLLEENNVSISSPQLEVQNYTYDDSSSLLDIIVSDTVVGKSVKIYVTYEGLSLADSFLLAEYYVDFFSVQSDRTILFNLKSSISNDVLVNGRKVSIYKNTTYKLGEDALAGTNKIPTEANGNVLPVSFGKGFAMPLVCYAYNVETDATYSVDVQGDLLFCAHDDAWWSELNNYSTTFNSFYQYNIDKTESKVFVKDNDSLIPIPQTDWFNTAKTTYTVTNDSDNVLRGIKITSSFNGSNHFGKDNSIFVAQPFRFVVESYDDSFKSADHIINPFTSISDVKAVFNGDRTSNLWTISTDGTNLRYIRININTALDINKNLRADSRGVVFNNRNISVLNTDRAAFAGYLSLAGNSGNTYNCEDQPQNTDGASVTFNMFVDSKIPSASTVYSHFIPSTVAANDAGATTIAPGDDYNYNITVFGDSTLAGFQNNIDFANDNNLLARPGAFVNKYTDTDAAYLRKVVVNDRNAMCRITVSLGTYTSGRNFDLKLANIHLLYNTNVPVAFNEPLSADMGNFCVITNENVLKSYNNPADYALSRPFEYVEAVLRAKCSATNDTLGDGWLSIEDSYNTLYLKEQDGDFVDLRKDSGFSIIKETKLSEFLKDYLVAEQFSVFEDADRKYNVVSLKEKYEEGDVQYTVDFNKIKNIVTGFFDTPLYYETDVNTDYVHSLDTYQLSRRWKLTELTGFDYSFWKSDNTYANNVFIKSDGINKKYTTSSSSIARVKHNSKYWGCIRTHFSSVEPGLSDSSYNYWTELSNTNDDATVYTGVADWNAVGYYGIDAENYLLARAYLNAHANKRRYISFESSDVDLQKLSLGDIISFSGVPYKFLGLNMKGFADNSTDFEVVVNAQTFYAAFIITSIKTTLNTVSIEATQLCDLAAIELDEVKS